MNVKLFIEDRVGPALRSIRRTSMNQLVRDFLHDPDGDGTNVKSTVVQNRRAVSRGNYRSQGPWTRVRNCMGDREFLDRNVPIHAHDARHPRKRTCARELIRRLLRDGRVLSRTEAP